MAQKNGESKCKNACLKKHSLKEEYVGKKAGPSGVNEFRDIFASRYFKVWAYLPGELSCTVDFDGGYDGLKDQRQRISLSSFIYGVAVSIYDSVKPEPMIFVQNGTDSPGAGEVFRRGRVIYVSCGGSRGLQKQPAIRSKAD